MFSYYTDLVTCNPVTRRAASFWIFCNVCETCPEHPSHTTDAYSTTGSTYDIYVQRKVRIGTIPELYLRIVRIPTLSADSGIVPDNSRIAQGIFYRFLL